MNAATANGSEDHAGPPAPLNQRRAKLLQDALSKLPPQNSSDLPLARHFEAVSRKTAAIRYDVDPKKRLVTEVSSAATDNRRTPIPLMLHVCTCARRWETLHALAKGSSGSVFLARCWLRIRVQGFRV